MELKNIQFFDNEGYNLNFNWNEKRELWEGNIYLPKVSVGLYANTTIYLLESNTDRTEFFFPTGNDKITFKWDILNTFVDEFFMFSFDNRYVPNVTSKLDYTPNDGPVLETLLINTYDEYEISLKNEKVYEALPIHIAFTTNAKYDATTYTRTLYLYHNNKAIASIKFYAETVEEDERLKIWNSNLGYNLKPEDTIIFKKSDIKECKPDYILLNEKRKELMLEGHNIYPYIGSYNAIINAIKFFGYNNLNIIEFWRNINSQDVNFGKLYHSTKYSLTEKETIRVENKIISMPNKDYRKVNKIALSYDINSPTGKVDIFELPETKDNFEYSLEEALVKLFALKRKLNKEFMPTSSTIVDIIGEANYFGINSIHKIGSSSVFKDHYEYKTPKIKIFPSNATSLPKLNYYIKYNEADSDSENDIVNHINKLSYVHISDDRYFEIFKHYKKNHNEEDSDSDYNTIHYYDSINKFKDVPINELSLDSNKIEDDLTNEEICELYEEYYNNIQKFTEVELPEYDDESIPESDYDDSDYTPIPISAKVILKNDTFETITFGNCYDSFGTKENMTFGNIDSYGYNSIKWDIEYSDNQYIEEYINIGINNKVFDIGYKGYHKTFTDKVDKLNKLYVQLPYVGYYDVEMTIIHNDGHEIKSKLYKAIKVEPYNIDIRGFYYDARELPEKLKYDSTPTDGEDEMKIFILQKLQEMTARAIPEHYWQKDSNQTMTVYTKDGNLSQYGPYYMSNVNDHWYLAENLNFEIGALYPNPTYARYIKNGVDVKPFTWFLLSYENTKIVSKKNPKWILTNTITKKQVTHEGKYFTYLLKDIGDYNIELTIDDNNGNHYSVNRNIIVVDNNANYKLYNRFKEDYDDYIDTKTQIELKQLLV